MNQELTDIQIHEHDQLSKEGWDILEGEIHIHDHSHLTKPGWFAKRKLRKAISLFEGAIEINPKSWASMWGLGKIYQRLEDDATALEWFVKSHQIIQTNPDVVREAALCAMNLGKVKEAIEFTNTAIELAPDDPGLIANLALALLLDHRPQEAKDKAEASVSANSTDVVSRNVLQYINEVISGKKLYPKSIKDIR
jgi:Flp pilus assembly protein TadD